MKTLVLAAMAAVGLPLTSLCAAEQPPAPPPTPHLEVYVKNSSTYDLISGATVRVVSKSGKTLASAVTDSSGMAALPILDPASEPDLILVLADPFYVGGTQWFQGARELCVHLVIWRTCDQVTIKGD